MLRLTATDSLLSTSADVTITVLPAPSTNNAPVVSAGPDRTITLPAAANLDGSVTDDGLPANVAVTAAWSKVTGPGTASFGDSTSAATSAQFDQPGTYVLRLTGSDTQLSSSATVTITVNPRPPTNRAPVVAGGTPQTVTLPAGATLDATVTDDGLPIGATVTSNWITFGGPGTATFANPSVPSTTVTFDQPGVYTLRITASDTQLTSSATVQITAVRANAAPVVNAGPDQSVTLPVNRVTLTGTASDDGLPAGSALKVQWLSTSGPAAVAFSTPTGLSTTATFNAAGTYVLTLRATDGDLTTDKALTVVVSPETISKPPVAHVGGPYRGETGNAIAFDGRSSSDPLGELLSYDWAFGDGGTATGPTPSHIYTTPSVGGPYSVNLRVSTASGRSASDTTTAEITAPATGGGAPPIANPGGPYAGIVGQIVSVDGSRSSDPGGQVLSYRWDFGDGATGTGPTPGHVYSAPGPANGFLVTLTVDNGRGGVATQSTTARVSVPPPTNRPPVAQPGGPYGAQSGAALSFDGSASSDPDGDPFTLTWTFGDGGTATGPRPSHAYATPGTFIVALTAIDAKGARNTATTAATIVAAPPTNRPPIALPGGPYRGDAGAAVAFDGRGSRDPDNDPLTYAWDFGDGTQGLGPTPTHVYVAGAFTATLAVTDGRGGSNQATVSVGIGPPVDRIAPAIQLVAPASVVPGTVFIVGAQATDNVGVTGVTFAVSGAGTASGPLDTTASPFSIQVTAGATANTGSTIVVTATARDAAGNTSGASATVSVVAAPDNTPPTVALSAPAAAPPGTTIVLTASAADNVGVQQVQFALGGVSIGLTAGAPYQISYPIPANAPAGSSLVFVATARDFAGNTADGQASVALVPGAPATPPSLTLTAPNEVAVGGTVHVSATAGDAIGVASVTFLVDDAPVATLTTGPYQASFVVPPGIGAGSVLKLTAHALNLAGLSSFAFAETRVIAASPAAGGIFGRVFDDATSQPIAGAAVRLVGQDGNGQPFALSTVTDAAGRYFLPTSGGTGFVEVTRAGWTRADRPVAFGIGAVAVFDSRLTRIVAGMPVTALLGGAVTSGAASLTLVPGTLATDGALEVTPVGQQGLAGLLPPGWSPVAVVDIGPRSLTFLGPATLTTTPASMPPASTVLVFAVWDETAHAWRALATPVVPAADPTLRADISAPGHFAWLLPDTAPTPPPMPAVGTTLNGVAPVDVPPGVTVAITPAPKLAVYAPGFRAAVGTALTTPLPLPSGTPLAARISEDYQLNGGGSIATEPATEGLTLYQQGGDPLHLAAAWSVGASVVLDPADLIQGVIAIDVVVPGSSAATTTALIGTDGGSVSLASGERLDAPAGALSAATAVQLATLDPATLGVTIPADFDIVGAVAVTFAGDPLLAQPVVLSVTRLPAVGATDLVLVLRLDDVLGATRFVMAGAGRVTAERIYSDAALPGIAAVPDAIRASGRYVFARLKVPTGVATGTVLSPVGLPLAGAVVSSNSMTVVGLSRIDRPYAVPVHVGPVTISAIDPTRADAGSASGGIANAGDVAQIDVQLVSARPGVLTIAPADGADNVPLGNPVVATFSTPLDPSVLTDPSLTPIGLTVDGTTVPVAGALTLDGGGRRLTFRPTTALDSNTRYRVVVDGTLRDIAGRTLAAAVTARFRSLDTAPPPPPAAGAVTVGIPDLGGFVAVSATQGTASPHDRVQIGNRTRNTITPVLVGGDGSFSGRVNAAPGDVLVLTITDQAGNQTSVPLSTATRQVNGDGSVSAVVGDGGGRIEGPAGIVVDVPAGAFPVATVVTVTAVGEAQFPIKLTDEQRPFFGFSGGFALDFRGAAPQHYLNVSLPAGPNDGPQDRWVFGQVTSFNGQLVLGVADTARVINGRITTSSPPCPGVLAQATYGAIKSVARPVGLTYGNVSSSSADLYGARLIGLTSLFALGTGLVGAIPALLTLPWAIVTTSVLAAPACLPVLSGRVTVVPNRQVLAIDAGSLMATDVSLVVQGAGSSYTYPRNLVTYRFVVDGDLTDQFTVTADSSAGSHPALFQVVQASAGQVAIKLGIDQVAADTSSITITNLATQIPKSFLVGAQTFALGADGAASDPFSVTALDADGNSRDVPFTLESPNGAERLLAQALPVTIDPGTDVFLLNDTTKAEIQIPASAIVDGGFRFAFDGNLDDSYLLRVDYHDGRAPDFTSIPKVQLTVSTATGRVVRTTTIPSPPPDEPFNLGTVDVPVTPPTLVSAPTSLNAFDPSGILSFTFSSGIDRASAIKGLKIIDGVNDVAGSVHLSNGNTVVTFVPDAPLQMGTTYLVRLDGLRDAIGRPVAATELNLTTFTPTMSASLPSSLQAGRLRSVVFKTLGVPGFSSHRFAITASQAGSTNNLVIFDVTVPAQATQVGFVQGPLGGDLALVENTSLTLAGNSPCGGGASFSGDLVIAPYSSTAGSSVQFYDVRVPSAPCLLGAKLLNLDPSFASTATTGAIRAPGVAVSVAGLRTSVGATAYVAVADLGLLSVDIGSNIPARSPPGTGDQAGILPGNYWMVRAVGGILAAVERSGQTLDLISPSLAVLGRADLSSVDLDPLALVHAPAFPVDRNGDGRIDPSEYLDLIFVGGSTSTGGAIAVVDITDPSTPELISVVPMAGPVYKLDVDANRQRVFAAADADLADDTRIMMLDFSGRTPFAAADANHDKVDDRVIWTSDEHVDSAAGFAFDSQRGQLYAYGSTGLGIWSLYNNCCDLGVDFRPKDIPLPSGDGEALLRREKTAIQTGIKAGLTLAAAACGVPVRPAGTPAKPGDDAVTILEQGSGACIWKPDPIAACAAVYVPGVSDHDFEVLIPSKYFDPSVIPDDAQCVVKTLSDQFSAADGTPKPIDVGGVPVTFRDLTFFPVKRERFEDAQLDLELPASTGTDATGDLGLGRQQLLLKWLLEGEYVDVPGFNLEGKPLDDVLTTFEKDTRIPVVEGYEWARLQNYVLAKARVLLRVAGSENADSSMHDVFVAQVHDAGKAGIRAALARMVVEPDILARVLSYTRTDYASGACLTITPGSNHTMWTDKPCAGFEEFIASMAGRAAIASPAPPFNDHEVADIVHRFFRVKSDQEHITTADEANGFIADAVKMVTSVVADTQADYDQAIVNDPDAEIRQVNMTRAIKKQQDAASGARLRIVPRVFNAGFRVADAVQLQMYRGTAGPGTPVKSVRVDLSPNTVAFMDREGQAELVPPDDVWAADRNLTDISVPQTPSRAPSIFTLGDPGNPVNPPVDLGADAGVVHYVAFTIDLPERKFPEADRFNNYDGFWYYVLDVDNPTPPTVAAKVPLPISDPTNALLRPDAECQEPTDVTLTQAVILPGSPDEITDRVLLNPDQQATLRIYVTNGSGRALTNVKVCSTLLDNFCQTIPTLAASQQVVVDKLFLAAGTNQVLDVVATASSPDLGVRTSPSLRVLVGCEPFSVVPPTPDPNPQPDDPPEVSQVMQGGNAVRYARVVNRVDGTPLAGSAVRVTVADSAGNTSTLPLTTDVDGYVTTGGVRGIVVPIGQNALVGTKMTLSVDQINGILSYCSAGTSFGATVADRTVKRVYAAGAAVAAEGTIEVGLQGKNGAGLTFTITESAAKGRQQLDIGRSFPAEFGVLEAIAKTGGREYFGSATLQAEAQLKTGGVVQLSFGDQHSFKFPGGAAQLTPSDGAIAGAVMAGALAGGGNPVLTRVMTTFFAAVDTTPKLATESASLGLEAQALGTAGVSGALDVTDQSTGTPLGTMGFGAGVSAASGAKIGFQWSVTTDRNKAEVTPGLEFRGSIDASRALGVGTGQDTVDPKTQATKIKLTEAFKASLRAGLAGSMKGSVTLDRNQGSAFKKVALAFAGSKVWGWQVGTKGTPSTDGYVPIDGGSGGTTKNTITLSSTNPNVFSALTGVLPTVLSLAQFNLNAASGSPGAAANALLSGPQTVVDELQHTVGFLMQSTVDYEVTEEIGSPFTLAWGGAAAVLGVGADIKASIAFDRSVAYTTQKGRIVNGQLFPLATYTRDNLVPDPSATGRVDDLEEILGATLGGLRSAVGDAIDVVGLKLAGGQQEIRSRHTAALSFNGDNQPGLTDGVTLSSFSFEALPPGVGPISHSPADIAWAPDQPHYGIGGYHQFAPDGLVLVNPATLTFFYKTDEVAGIDERTLAIYRWDRDAVDWAYLGGTPDPVSHTVSVAVDRLGLYTVGTPMPSGRIVFNAQAQAAGDALNPHTIVTYTSGPLTQNTGQPVPDGTVYTVAGARVGTTYIPFGAVLSTDVDQATAGVQVASAGGAITFVVDYPAASGEAVPIALSREGTAAATSPLAIRPLQP